MSMSLRIGAAGFPVGVPEVSAQRRPLTEGIPDPEAVQRQKEEYARSLEDQLRRGVEVLAATHKQQTDLLHAQANQEKQRYNLALDQQVKQQELALSQHYNQQLMRLQQAAQAQRADLEQQACGITLEYQQRKVQEEYFSQQLGIQKQHVEAQSKLALEIQKLSSAPAAGTAGAMQVPALPPVVTTLPPAGTASGTMPSTGPVPSMVTFSPAASTMPYALPKSTSSTGQVSSVTYSYANASPAQSITMAVPGAAAAPGAAPMQMTPSYMTTSQPAAKLSYTPPPVAS
mmetsp:Transcript_6109/g.11009  ORF Transcript_6109/g.11009 Transcript_6109/m.11009 type:complete len:287 (-) Transcript_6109:163-1023(-)